ncbi:MAG: hypothetical protein V4662_24100 [Verrucomicrobiota bacterium]
MKASRFAAILVLAASLSQGATIISYTATADPAGSPDGTITSGGSGTANVWSTSTTGTAGSFSADSASNGDNSNVGGTGAGNPAWALWSNTGGESNAVHTLAGGALSVGQGIDLDFDNGFVNSGGTVGVSLQNAAGQNLFEFFFTGGNPNYRRNDFGGVVDTTTGFTDNGLDFSFALNSATGYTASLAGTAFSGSLISQTDQAIARVRVFNSSNQGNNGDNDLFFNNLAVSPEPSRLLFLALGLTLMGGRRRRY